MRVNGSRTGAIVLLLAIPLVHPDAPVMAAEAPKTTKAMEALQKLEEDAAKHNPTASYIDGMSNEGEAAAERMLAETRTRTDRQIRLMKMAFGFIFGSTRSTEEYCRSQDVDTSVFSTAFLRVNREPYAKAQLLAAHLGMSEDALYQEAHEILRTLNDKMAASLTQELHLTPKQYCEVLRAAPEEILREATMSKATPAIYQALMAEKVE